MNRYVTEEQAYKKMCAKFEKAKIYDGRGTEDLYECHDCDHMLWFTYVDKGVTPFSILCDRCGGVMSHVKTLPFILMPVDIEWVRPSFEEYRQLSEAEQAHVQDGGLIKRYRKHGKD